MLVLIIGANGFLGTNILDLRLNPESISQYFNFYAADIENNLIPKDIPFNYIDITNKEDCLKKIIKISPDVVLLNAAMTDVDKCETYRDIAHKVNVIGPKNVLNACEILKTKMVFLSTDFIFDGLSKNGGYTENDSPNPTSYYAQTKCDAEKAILNSKAESLICRTAVLYGWNSIKLNFITWIIEKLRNNEKVSIVTDQSNNPTFVRNLAEILLALIEKDASGIFHTAGNGTLNRYEMALKVADIFEFERVLISPIDKISQLAQRPKNAGLDISKLKSVLGPKFNIFSLEDGLNYMKQHPF